MKYAVSFVLFSLFSCHQPSKKIVLKNHINTDSLNKEQYNTARKQIVDRDKADSVQQNKVINDVLIYVNNHKNTRHLRNTLKLWKDTSISATIIYGNLFSTKRKHLFIKSSVGEVYEFFNIFILEKSGFKSVFYTTEGNLNFIDYSIKDINGDRQKDFSIIWEATSGCCLREDYDVYLYNAKSGGFSRAYNFINPTFSPSEKIIRGVAYGHPGEVPLYKYKWNGPRIDTIELIYPVDLSEKSFYKVRHFGDQRKPDKRKMLASVPKEYLKIHGYDWFTDIE